MTRRGDRSFAEEAGGLRAPAAGVPKSVIVYEHSRPVAPHKPRADRGSPRLTARDLAVLTWIGQQYAVRIDTLRKLLGRQAGTGGRPVAEAGRIAPRNVRRVLARWQALQLVVYRKLLHHEPGWVWLRHKGLREMGLPYRLYTPAAASLRHMHVVNELRVQLEARYGPRLAWKSERQLRREVEQLPEGERQHIHVTDAEITVDGVGIGVEVELTQKSAKRLARILARLRNQYAAVWYFVTDATAPAVQRARAGNTQVFKVYNLKEVLG